MNRELSNDEQPKCSIPLVVRKMPIETTWPFHLTLVRRTEINKISDRICWQGCEEKDTFPHCQWECELAQCMWESVWWVFRKLGSTSGSNSTNLHHIPKGPQLLRQRHLLIHAHCCSIYYQKLE